jgi:hypothetical protein
MRDLTFPIGLPETGTTALQKHVFPSLPGHVGKFYGTAPHRPEQTRLPQRGVASRGIQRRRSGRRHHAHVDGRMSGDVAAGSAGTW